MAATGGKGGHLSLPVSRQRQQIKKDKEILWYFLKSVFHSFQSFHWQLSAAEHLLLRLPTSRVERGQTPPGGRHVQWLTSISLSSLPRFSVFISFFNQMQLSLFLLGTLICTVGSAATLSADQAIARDAAFLPESPTNSALHADEESASFGAGASDDRGPLPLPPELQIGGIETDENKRLLPGEEHAAALKARRPALRGIKFLLAGLFLLGVGVGLTLAGRRVKQSRTEGDSAANSSFQVSVQILDKLGVTSASKLAIGYILAGLIELFRSGLSKASSASNTGTGAQTDEQQKPALRGGLLLALAVGSMLASLSAGGLDLSTLKWGELTSLLMQYGMQAYLGLFAAGGYELLSSAVAAHKYDKTQQQQQQQQEQQQQEQQQQEQQQEQQQQEQEQQENGEEAAASSSADQVPFQAQNETPQSAQQREASRSVSGLPEAFSAAQEAAETAALINPQVADAAAVAQNLDPTFSDFLTPENPLDLMADDEVASFFEEKQARGEEERREGQQQQTK
ncbi:hypothetical protein Emed_004484 [Eimeria media]